MNIPALRSTTVFILLSLLGGFSAQADAASCCAAAEAPTLRLASSALALEWVESAEGWSLKQVTADGIAVARPQGFTNILYNAKKTHEGAVPRMKRARTSPSTFPRRCNTPGRA